MNSFSIRTGLAMLAAVLLAGFFAFVGWNKAFASLEDLARHRAWTVFLPEDLGRLIGWSEMVLAAGLLAALVPRLRRIAMFSALLLAANQLCAAVVHATNHEASALPQNAVLIALLALVAFQTREMIR